MDENLYKIIGFTYCLVVLFGVVLIFASLSRGPSFNQLNTRVKKLEKKPKIRSLMYLKRDIEKSFKNKKIDGLERLYLCQRLQPLESRFQPKADVPGPKYAAGGPMDRLGPPR